MSTNLARPLSPARAFTPAVIVMATLFYSSSMEADQLPGVEISDKLAHLIAYGLLTFTWLYGFARGTRLSMPAVYTLSLVLSGLYGVSDEYHQSFVPGRDTSGLDIVANLAGALLCISLYIALHKRTYFSFLNLRRDRPAVKTET